MARVQIFVLAYSHRRGKQAATLNLKNELKRMLKTRYVLSESAEPLCQMSPI